MFAMKTNRLLLVISIVSFITVSFISCSEDGMMDKGGTAGDPPPPNMNSVLASDSIAAKTYRPNN